MNANSFFSKLVFCGLCFSFLTGCDSIDHLPDTFRAAATHAPEAHPTETPSAGNLTTPTPAGAVITSSATPDPAQVLTVWLPPELDPKNNSTASQLFAARLKTFEDQQNHIQIHVRIKNASGTQGMLDTLALTRAVAPLALPSVAVLSYLDLGSAVRQELVYPIDSISSLADGKDWYPYSQDMAHVNQQWYGAPFSGDALVLVYRGDGINITPERWEDILAYGQPVYFPAADANALTILALYQSLEVNENRSINPQELNEDNLVRLFTFYQRGAQRGVFPYSLSQFDRFEQTWAAYNNHQTRWVIAWASDYLKSGNDGSDVIPLPGLNNTPFTLATGSLLVLTEPDPARQAASLQLIDFLTNPDFLSDINQAGGTLPPRISANHYASDTRKKAFVEHVSLSAYVQPVPGTYSDLAKDLNDATNQVIRFRLNAQEAAQSVMDGPQKAP
ncbi:MAG: extracellular solute-binding protein [Anaerolineae bacterium]|nr:extracellular solute-binding protein [Anaerolineae bacterium]